ncbi:hypothetical protein WN51_07842 [Melipona quadrifasciata]|uniref:Uncharacterized protein n=1 Tax=Melipona quadrifasciata TaxID=166423 RepID=A0A0M9A6U0_9HYME|nr:hypothetical protein WN51_07842 [Melipona quadrifasciata]
MYGPIKKKSKDDLENFETPRHTRKIEPPYSPLQNHATFVFKTSEFQLFQSYPSYVIHPKYILSLICTSSLAKELYRGLGRT